MRGNVNFIFLPYLARKFTYFLPFGQVFFFFSRACVLILHDESAKRRVCLPGSSISGSRLVDYCVETRKSFSPQRVCPDIPRERVLNIPKTGCFAQITKKVLRKWEELRNFAEENKIRRYETKNEVFSPFSTFRFSLFTFISSPSLLLFLPTG